MKNIELAETRLKCVYEKLNGLTEVQETQVKSGLEMLVSFAEKEGYIRVSKVE